MRKDSTPISNELFFLWNPILGFLTIGPILPDLRGVPVLLEMEASQMVNLPTFTGKTPLGGLRGLNFFFEVQETHEFDHLQWDFMSMEGEAMRWFSSWCQEDSNLNQTSFASNLILRFRTCYDNYVAEGFSTLKQEVQREGKNHIDEVKQLVETAEKKQEMGRDQILGDMKSDKKVGWR